jgi:hypothetical protein
MKKCSKCLRVLPFNSFGKQKSQKDGFRSICRHCKIKQDYLYRQKPETKKKRYKYFKKYSEKYPEKIKAHIMVRTKLIEKHPCEVCGKESNVEAHHTDYNKPLQVIWLCKKHHEEIHRKGAECYLAVLSYT